MLRWFKRTRVKLGSISGLLYALGVLTDVWGLASDLMNPLQQIGLDFLPAALRFSAFLLLPFSVVGTCMALVSAVSASLRWMILTYDTARKNDHWAARELQSSVPRVESCIRELGNVMSTSRLERYPELHVHLLQLAAHLDRLGISITPEDTWNAALWHYRLRILAAHASYGDIESARRLNTEG